MATKRSNGFEKMQDEESDSEGILNLEDFDSGKKKRYKVNLIEEGICNRPVTRRDIICIAIGGVVVGVAVVLFIILGVALQPSKNGGQEEDDVWMDVRLPSTLEPQLYTVYLEPDLNTFKVTGSVAIQVHVLSDTRYIILHVKDMNVSDVGVSVNEVDRSLNDMFLYEENNFLVLEVDELKADNIVQVSMNFNYTLRDDLVGFYKSSYTTATGETRYLATTQFEPTDARTAFPCFDEPGMKANFSISISHDMKYNATSNMSPTSVVKRDGSVVTRFQTSYKMSTYLVAFVVSDFSCSNSAIVNDHIKVRVCASPEVFNDTVYAQEVAEVVIGYYEDFFGVKYPLPKQDLFAIPDFSAGAMENWGLITYRETALIYDETQNPLSSKQRVAVVIAHELAHQWFGNLVTMAWWDGLWLNEGFASYVEYIGTNHKEKEWNMLEQFYVDTIQSAYAADGLNWSHPILQSVSDPDEINGLFDSISYDKGASLIRMLLNYIGNESFTTGLANYLKAHEFGNAETHDLWESLNNEVSSLPNNLTVSKMMDTWTKQMGYPVVCVSRSDRTITVTQERFLLNPLPSGGEMAPSPYDYVWIIPFDYITSTKSSSTKKLIFSNRQDTFTLSSSDGFIKANVKQNGFYRVNYDLQNWQAIINHLKQSPNSNVLSPVDRAGVMDDAFALSSAGIINITVALDMSLYLRNERDYVPWSASITWLYILSDRLSLTEIYGKYQRYVSYLLNDTITQYHFDVTDLSHLETFLQTEVLLAGWRFGNEDIGNTASSMFRNWMTNADQLIPPNLRVVVYPAAIAYGGEEEWEFLWQRYVNTSDPYEKILCLFGLSHSNEPWILSRYLQYSLYRVRSQDTLYVIRKVSENVQGRYLAWNFFRDNWNTLFEKYGGGSFSFVRVIRALTKSFSTEWELQEVDMFFTEHQDAGSGTLAVEQAKETIRGNILWLKTNKDVVNNWFDKNIPV